jgi:hypothetical protein
MNAVDSPGSTATQNYWLCARFALATSSISYAEITLQEIRAGSDIAEVYYAADDTPLTAGDVVSLDPSLRDGVRQSQSAYDNTLLGVISTQPGAVLGNSDPSSGVQELVALAGRVPIHVTNENGDVDAGDYLTSSDIPGVAMRATEPGRVIGIAMESFAPDPSEGTTTGSILAFVNPGWSPGSTADVAGSASSTFSINGVLQNFFGIVVSAANAIESSVIAAVNLFARIFTILPGGSIVVPQGQNQISGQGLLAPDDTDVFIANTSVTSSSEVIVTPTSPSQLPLAVTKITDGSGFDVGTIGPQQIPVSFTWLIIGTYATDPSSPAPAGQGSSGQSVSVVPLAPILTSSAGSDNGSSTDTADATDIANDTSTDMTDTTDSASTTNVSSTDTADAMDGATTTDATDTSNAADTTDATQ